MLLLWILFMAMSMTFGSPIVTCEEEGLRVQGCLREHFHKTDPHRLHHPDKLEEVKTIVENFNKCLDTITCSQIQTALAPIKTKLDIFLKLSESYDCLSSDRFPIVFSFCHNPDCNGNINAQCLVKLMKSEEKCGSQDFARLLDLGPMFTKHCEEEKASRNSS